MVYQVKDGPMTEREWEFLGHEYHKNDLACLPTRRLDIPLPASRDGLHTLAHRLVGLTEELHRIARHAPTNRSAMSEADSLLKLWRNQLKRLQKDWETELREAEARETEEAGNVARIGKVG